MEVLGYPFASIEEEKTITKLCNSLILINLDNKIISKVINLRKKVNIKIPDAIIAGTALIHDLDLITRNTDDFKFLKKDLKLFDPFKK